MGATSGGPDDTVQPVGAPVPGWRGATPVTPVALTGRTCRLEPLAPRHDAGLYAALCEQSPPRTWTYLPTGPFDRLEDFAARTEELRRAEDRFPHVILGPDDRPLGMASWLRADPPNGTVEVGWIVLSAAVQRTTAATEAMYLMARHALDDLGYRRYEWKCDALNAASCRAAERLGFRHEGTFRQAVVYKGRNRDTAWYAVTDADWPVVRAELERWLDPANHDAGGGQRTRLVMPAPAG